MQEQFIPYEQALALKELGFDEECFGYYYLDSNNKSGLTQPQSSFKRWYTGKEVLAPLWQQAFDWFRDKHNLFADLYTVNVGCIEYCFQIVDLYSEECLYDNFKGAANSYSGIFNFYEEARLACLQKLIEIVKNK
jgi:hypothetical protein